MGFWQFLNWHNDRSFAIILFAFNFKNMVYKHNILG